MTTHNDYLDWLTHEQDVLARQDMRQCESCGDEHGKDDMQRLPGGIWLCETCYELLDKEDSKP